MTRVPGNQGLVSLIFAQNKFNICFLGHYKIVNLASNYLGTYWAPTESPDALIDAKQVVASGGRNSCRGESLPSSKAVVAQGAFEMATISEHNFFEMIII